MVVTAAPAATMWALRHMEADPSVPLGALVGIAGLPTQPQDYRTHPRKVSPSPVATADTGLGSGHKHLNGAIISIADIEKGAILSTIQQLNGDKLMAAQLLGISRTTIYRKLKEYGLTKADNRTTIEVTS